MKLAIITSCPTGIVTSVLSARLVDAAARRLGWSTMVEIHDRTQWTPLSAQQIQQADLVAVIHTGDIDLTRFAGKKIYRSSASDAMRDIEGFLQRVRNESVLWNTTQQASVPPPVATSPRLVAITACPTGVAHTFMAAEALQNAARKMGIELALETQGSVGARTPLSKDAIARADSVLLATDIEVNTDRFVGKKVYRCGTSIALKQPEETLQRALVDGEALKEGSAAASTADQSGTAKAGSAGAVYKHLLTGVSYMLPMVVAGGLLIALSFVFGINAASEPGTLAAALMQIGGDSAFKLMVPLLAGYIAYSIADRPGLAPGMIGGLLATTLGAGFLGGIVAGFLAGYISLGLARGIRLPASVEALKPILIIPLVASLATGLLMIYAVGAPVKYVLDGLTHTLATMGTTNAVLLGAVLGAMMCVDLGGPVNKAAYAFTVGLLASKTYGPMAATMAGGMVPAIGMGVATVLARSKFSQSEKDAGKASFVLGLCFISEGAIPFAAKDPLRVIPSCIAGGALTGAMVMYFQCQLLAPHGGLFVMLIPNAINQPWLYLASITAGSAVTAVLYAVLKRRDSADLEFARMSKDAATV